MLVLYKMQKNQSFHNKFAYFIESLLHNTTFSFFKKYVQLQNLTSFFLLFGKYQY